MQEFNVAFLFGSWVELVKLKKFLGQVISYGFIDLESSNILNYDVGKDSQWFDVLSFCLVLVTEELDLN